MSLIFHLPVREQPIVRGQVRHHDGHLRGWRRGLPATHEPGHRFTCQPTILGQQHAQGVVHQRLAFPRRQVKDLQIFPVRLTRGSFAQHVVGRAKTARGEQLGAVLIAGEGTGLAHQPVDDVPIINARLLLATQTRQALDAALGVPHFQVLDVDPDIDAFADEPAVHRVEIALHADQAALRHRHAHALATLLPAGRQRPQQRPLLVQTFLPARVPPPRHLAQEGQILRPLGEIAAATQQQRLRDRLLEVPVRRFHVAVFVTRRRVRLLHRQAVVPHQLLVTPRELTLVRQVVHRRAQPIAAMPLRHAAQLLQRILESFTQTLETLREANRHRLPVRVGQHEVIDQMIERLTAEGYAEVVHRREIRSAQSAGKVLLAEEDFLGRTRRRPPLPHAALQRPHLARLEPIRIFPLQPLEQRLGLQRRFPLELGHDVFPHTVERIGPGSPIAWLFPVAGKFAHVSVPPCRFAIHAGLGRRRRQRLACLQEPPQPLHLTIRDPGHRKLLFHGACDSVRMFSGRAQLRCEWGVVIVVSGEK
jgi:hypothetical protein